MIQLVLELHDHVGEVYDEFRFIFGDQDTLNQLKEKIRSVWHIDEEHQQLFFEDGERLDELDKGSLQSFGLKDGSRVIVKHSNFDKWEAFLTSVKEFNNSEVNDTKQTSAESARCFFLSLRKLFLVYPKLFDEGFTHYKPISKYLDKRTDWIKNAATYFFNLSMFKGQDPVVKFEEIQRGTRAALICNVTVNSITHKYRIKTMENHGKSGEISCWEVDLIELYCDKLLESIGVGPKIVFIPNYVESKSTMYIASEWMPEFQPFNSIEQDNPTELSHATVQFHFLASFLSLCDMEEKSFGLNGNSDPIILDFMTTNYRDPVNGFLYQDNMIYSYLTRDILKTCDSTARLQIAKDAVQKWNLIEKMDEGLKLMDKIVEDFGRSKMDFDKKTKNLEEYVKNVKSKELFLRDSENP